MIPKQKAPPHHGGMVNLCHGCINEFVCIKSGFTCNAVGWIREENRGEQWSPLSPVLVAARKKRLAKRGLGPAIARILFGFGLALFTAGLVLADAWAGIIGAGCMSMGAACDWEDRP